MEHRKNYLTLAAYARAGARRSQIYSRSSGMENTDSAETLQVPVEKKIIKVS